MILKPTEAVKDKLQAIISRGRENVEKAMADIDHEFQVRKDVVVKPAALDYRVDEKGLALIVGPVGQREIIAPTQFAKDQLLAKLNFPSRYMDTLAEIGEYDLIRENMVHLTEKKAEKGMLLRKVGDTVKGVLSPSYRRMDASPIIAAFIQQAVKEGMVPYEGKNTDYRYAVRFLSQEIQNPTGNEYVTYGASLSTSDYGASALKLELFILRLICENGAVGMDVFKHVHIGRRFDDFNGADVVELSDKTLKLDMDTIASAMKDGMKALPESFNVLNTKIANAATIGMTTVEAMAVLKSKNLGKEVLNEAKALYEMPDTVQELPAGKTAWRLSNVLSMMANKQGLKEDVRLDMQALAMDVLPA